MSVFSVLRGQFVCAVVNTAHNLSASFFTVDDIQTESVGESSIPMSEKHVRK